MLVTSFTYNFTMNGVSKVLVHSDNETSGDEESGGELVVELEGEVIDGGLVGAKDGLGDALDDPEARHDASDQLIELLHLQLLLPLLLLLSFLLQLNPVDFLTVSSTVLTGVTAALHK